MKSTLERIEARKKGASGEEKPKHSFMETIRGTLDALVFAYILAMFLRTFVFELFMIPTGSMTPTLIGDNAGDVVFFDYDGDGIDDVVFRRAGAPLQIFTMNEDDTYKNLLFLDGYEIRRWNDLGLRSPRRKDMIVVNKFAYWFSAPKRGDIAVFKVPDRPDTDVPGRSVFDPTKPVYIKRVVGLPGEFVEIPYAEPVRVAMGDPNRISNRLGGVEYHMFTEPIIADGEPVQSDRLDILHFFSRPTQQSFIPSQRDGINSLLVDENAVLMLGDNATSSKDGRYWGDVPLDHLRGKAIFRYYPLGAAGFLK